VALEVAVVSNAFARLRSTEAAACRFALFCFVLLLDHRFDEKHPHRFEKYQFDEWHRYLFDE
jgi:hypothetical protein